MGADDFFTLVTWELAAIPSGCRVKLTHSRWPDTARTYKNVTKTWTEILRLLKIDLETGNIPMGTKLMYGMFSALEFMLPKSTSVEEINRSGW